MSWSNSTRLPLVGELRKRLDYHDKTLERCKSFYDVCRLFIRQYIDENGVAGKHFYDRTCRDHVDAVETMVELFLNSEGNGDYWWPDSPDHRNANTLRYSTNKQHITMTMQLLVLKLNHQARVNTRWKGSPDDDPIQALPACRDQSTNAHQPAAWGFHVGNRINIDRTYHQAMFSLESPENASESQQPAASSSSDPDRFPVLSETSASTGHVSFPMTRPTNESPVEGVQRSDFCKMPSPTEHSDPRNSAQEAPSRLRVTQSEPATAARTSTGAHRGRRTPTAATQHSRKKSKGKTHLRGLTYQTKRMPQRKSSRAKRQIYSKLSFSDEDLTKRSTVKVVEAVTGNTEEGAVLEAIQGAPNAALMATPSTIPSSMLASGSDPTEAAATSMVFDAEFGTAASFAPVPSLAPAPAVPQAVESREEQVASMTNDATSAAISGIDTYLFSRTNTFHHSGTSEAWRAQTAEDLERRTRETEAPVTVCSDIEPQSSPPARNTSPPISETEHDGWDGGYSVAETTNGLFDSKSATHISTLSPELLSARVTPQRSIAQTFPEQDLAKDPESAREEKETTTGEPTQPPAGPSLQIPVRSQLGLYVIYGPKSRCEPWTPTESFLSLTMAKMKEEMPFQLSADFRGFKIVFVGEGQRTDWEVGDGDEDQLRHVQLDVEEVMENWKAENHGKLIFQLRIEELRDDDVNEGRAES